MKRLIKILLLVIIPALVAVGVGIYSYHRYQNYFYTYYLDSAKYKDTEDLLDRYMLFNDTFYSEYIKEDIKNGENKNLFTLAVYKEFDEITNEEDDTTENTMKYTFYIYNVDYENVYRTIPGYDDASKHKFNDYLATFKLIITDSADEDNKIELTLSTNTAYSFKDYGFKGVGDTQKWQNGDKISTAYVKWAEIDVSEYEISESVKIEIQAIDSQYPNEEDGNNFTAFEKDVTDFYTNVKKLDTEAKKYNGEELKEAYNGDVKKAGYNKYVFAKWMWWECLIGIALTLVITGSICIIWVGSEKDEKEQGEKNKK